MCEKLTFVNQEIVKKNTEIQKMPIATVKAII